MGFFFCSMVNILIYTATWTRLRPQTYTLVQMTTISLCMNIYNIHERISVCLYEFLIFRFTSGSPIQLLLLNHSSHKHWERTYKNYYINYYKHKTSVAHNWKISKWWKLKKRRQRKEQSDEKREKKNTTTIDQSIEERWELQSKQ